MNNGKTSTYDLSELLDFFEEDARIFAYNQRISSQSGTGVHLPMPQLPTPINFPPVQNEPEEPTNQKKLSRAPRFPLFSRGLTSKEQLPNWHLPPFVNLELHPFEETSNQTTIDTSPSMPLMLIGNQKVSHETTVFKQSPPQPLAPLPRVLSSKKKSLSKQAPVNSRKAGENENRKPSRQCWACHLYKYENQSRCLECSKSLMCSTPED